MIPRFLSVTDLMIKLAHLDLQIGILINTPQSHKNTPYIHTTHYITLTSTGLTQSPLNKT